MLLLVASFRVACYLTVHFFEASTIERSVDRRILMFRFVCFKADGEKTVLREMLIFSVICASPVGAAEPMMRFPGRVWEVVKPEEEGLDADRLRAAVECLKEGVGRDGVKELVIVRRGRVVWQGEDSDKVHGIWSCTKSFTSTVLGLLIADGKCSLDTKAASLHRPLKVKYANVTLRHFVTMTSGYRAAGDAEATGGYLHGPSDRPFEPAEPLFAPERSMPIGTRR